MNLVTVLADALMITGFVFVMMLIVEVVNVVSAGTLARVLGRGGLAAYGGAGLLGIAPGCLGSFAAVVVYVHRYLSLGALVTNMIATSGDEAFVMLALFPSRAVLLFALLLVYGMAVGWIVDRLTGCTTFGGARCSTGLVVHEAERVNLGSLFSRPAALSGLSLARATLCLSLALFLLAVGTGAVGPDEWNWVRFSLLGLGAVAWWIVFSVPDHFLEEHLWQHVAREHLPRIFAWVLGVLLLLAAAEAGRLPVAEWVQGHPWVALLLATLVGVVPESGPHLVFVTLYAQGALPFSVLVASSVVQDGHGMLPLLAESRREFVKVKLINVAAGLLLGGALLAAGL